MMDTQKTRTSRWGKVKREGKGERRSTSPGWTKKNPGPGRGGSTGRGGKGGGGGISGSPGRANQKGGDEGTGNPGFYLLLARGSGEPDGKEIPVKSLEGGAEWEDDEEEEEEEAGLSRSAFQKARLGGRKKKKRGEVFA